jgi:Glycosyl transferase family group 2
LVFITWLFPVFIFSSIVYGRIRAQLCFKSTDSIKKIIIQITTIGNHNIVNLNIQTIRSYNLDLPYEIWVVTESPNLDRYKGADRVLKVPRDFKSVARFKSRALDYSSQVRRKLGIITQDVKILFSDDDTIPSKEYIKKCLIGDYDIMEGVLQPALNYGTRYSYVENMRTLACMSVCSVYQSHGHPVWVHGEGMCIKASTEKDIGWKFDVIASEDLVFGHKCATRKMKWGFVWEPIYITSPWTLRDFFMQRRRWLWGNVHAISKILTWKSKIRMIWFYIVGGCSLWISLSGAISDLIGIMTFSPNERILTYISLAIWLEIYATIGYTVGKGKIRHIVMSMILMWYTSIMNTLPIWIGILLPRPKKFEVIIKEKYGAKNNQTEM